MVYIIKVKTNGASNDSPVRMVDGILRLSDVESADIYDGKQYVIRKKIPVYTEEQLSNIQRSGVGQAVTGIYCK